MYNIIRKKTIIILCIVMSILVLLCGCSGSKDKDESKEVEQDQIVDLKSFNGYTLKGNMFTNEMFADYDATIVYFWAPWSEASVYELKNIGILAKRLPENVYLITVCLDSDEGKPKKILADYDMSRVRTFVDGDADLKTACDSINNIPCTIIVNEAGTVMGKPIVGIQENFEKVYLKSLNKAMKASGNKPVTLLDLTEEAEENTEEVAEEKTTEEKPETDESKDEEENVSEEEGSEDSGDDNSENSEDSESSGDSEDSESSGDEESNYSEDSEESDSDMTDFD